MKSYDTAKEILRRCYPSATFQSQPSADWQGEFTLPDSIVQYFKEFGPVNVTIRAYGNPYFLPSLERLWDFQAGYRHHPETKKRFPTWDDDWLMIADEGGDPFILSRETGNIFHAYHGEGFWDARPTFDSLVEMVTTFAIIGDIVKSAGRDLTDEDSFILPRYLDEARVRLGEFLGSNERADTLLQTLGWEW